MVAKQTLEETVKEKVLPLLEETMERELGLAIPQLEDDIVDKLSSPSLAIYINFETDFKSAKKEFKKEFFKRELQFHLGNVSQLAKALDIDRRSVHRVIKHLDIDVDELRSNETSEELSRELIDKTIRGTLEQYKSVLHPEKIEKMYEQVSTLSRNIAKFLPHKDMTWKQAEVEFEREFFGHALSQGERPLTAVAHEIGIRVETLHRKLKQLGIK